MKGGAGAPDSFKISIDGGPVCGPPTPCEAELGNDECSGAELLTERERQVAVALLRGHSAKSVARLLAIAPGTVTVHRKNLYNKLGIRSQAELFSRFIEALEAS